MRKQLIAALFLALLLFSARAEQEMETELLPEEEATVEPTQTPSAQTEFLFEPFEDGVMVTGRTGHDARLVLPDMLEGQPVRLIAESAFSQETMLTEVVLPKTLIGIASGAFAGCKNLQSVVFEGGRENVQIAEDAFPEGVIFETEETPLPTQAPRYAISDVQAHYEREHKYTGSPITFTCTLTYKGNLLTKDRDYAETWKNNTAAGVGRLVVRGIGAFTGELELPFDIVNTDSGTQYSGDDVYIPSVGGTPEGDRTAGTTNYDREESETGITVNGITIGALLFCVDTDAVFETQWTYDEEPGGEGVLSVQEKTAGETAVCLKITQDQIRTLLKMHCCAVRYTVRDAQVLLPLSLLSEELTFTREVADDTSFTGLRSEEFTAVPETVVLRLHAAADFSVPWESPLRTDVYQIELCAQSDGISTHVLPQKDGVLLRFDVQGISAVRACDEALDPIDAEYDEDGILLFSDGYYAAA